MRMSKYRPNRDQIRYILACLAVGLAVCGCVMLAIRAQFVRQIRAQTIDAAQKRVVVCQGMFERFVLQMEEIKVQLSADAELSRNRLALHGYNVYNARRVLNRYVVANALYEEIALFSPLREDSFVLSSNGSCRPEVFFQRYAGMELGAFFRSFTGEETARVAVLTADGSRLGFAYTLPESGEGNTRVLLFIAKRSGIDQLLSVPLSGENGKLAIYDKETWRVLYNNGEEAPQDSYAYLATADSSYAPWRYEYLQSNAGMLTEMARMQRYMGFTLLFSALFTLILSMFLGVWVHRPLRRLTQILGSDSEPGGVDALASRMQDALRRNRELAEEMTDYKGILGDYVVQLALQGCPKEISLRRAMAAAGFRLDAALYTVAYIPLPPNRNGGLDSFEERLALRDAIQAAVSRWGSAFCIEWYASAMAVLLNHDEPIADMRDLYDAVQPAWAETAGFDLALLSIGVGSTVLRLEDAHTSLLRAMAAAEYARFKGWELCDSRQLERVHEKTDEAESTRQSSEALLAALRNADDAEARAQVERMLQQWQSGYASVETIHLESIVALEQLTDLIKSLRLDSCQRHLPGLLEYTTVVEYGERLNACCADICAALRAGQSEIGQGDLKRAMRFIDEHYMRVGLSVPDIAREVGLSASPLFRLFQRYLSTTPGKYLEHKRIDKARELLSCTSMPIKDVVIAVGYSDTSSFVRKFKEWEGMTPSQYRVMRQMAGE